MPLFSQRKGLAPAKAIQRESINADTRNALWTVLTEMFDHRQHPGDYRLYLFRDPMNMLMYRWWAEFSRQPGDEYPGLEEGIAAMRHWFFRAKWNEIFDLLEFLAQTIAIAKASQQWAVLGLLLPNFINACDRVLVSECCAYRFIGGTISEITSQAGIESIERGLNSSIPTATSHLSKALGFLTDRKNPDYPNSVKESVSALEAAVRDITGREGATLGDAMKLIRGRGALHPALEKAIQGLYGYASEEGGIRHAAKGEDRVSQAEARLALVAASAICDFLGTNAVELRAQFSQ